MKHSESITKLSDALCKAQSEMPEIPMDGINPHFHSKFSTLGAVIKGTRPVFSKHGLSILQLPSGGNGEIGLTTRIIHVSGEWIEETAWMSVPNGANPGQEFGKLITYLRRYSLASAAGVYSDEDTDNESGKKGDQSVNMDIITDEAWGKWQELVKQANDAGITVVMVNRDEYTRTKLLKRYKDLEKLVKEATEKVGA